MGHGVGQGAWGGWSGRAALLEVDTEGATQALFIRPIKGDVLRDRARLTWAISTRLSFKAVDHLTSELK